VATQINFDNLPKNQQGGGAVSAKIGKARPEALDI
jgi:hypothetical protein